MKKVITFLSSALILCTVCFSQEKAFNISAGLSSGIPFYGSSSLKTEVEDYATDSRIIIGALGAANLNISKPVTIFGGVDFLSDLNWNSDNNCNIFSLDFSLGIKIYPSLGGLNLGLAYVLGYRSVYDTERNPSAWGNGTKLSLEYNFVHEGKSKYLPNVGLYWKRMPRGMDTFDNQLCAYAMFNF